MEQQISPNYSNIILTIKNAILQSRYRAASLANRELLSLYYGIGKYISENSRTHFWGTNAIETISEHLQQELPGLRGFSAGNIRKMRIFFEQWNEYIENRALLTYDLKFTENENIEFCALTTHEIGKLSSGFLKIGFTHHYEILKKATSFEERLFYIEHCANEFWSVEKLQYNLKSNLYDKQGRLPNNFKITISDKDFRRKAMLSFKDEFYLTISTSTVIAAPVGKGTSVRSL